MNRYWYVYLGGDVANPSNYNRLPNNVSIKDVCPGGKALCAIYSPPNNLNPLKPQDVSSNIQSYVPVAQAIDGSYPTYPDEAFVYTKPSV